MNSSGKGNNPQVWEKLLETLDEKLQFGLLEHLRRIASYHFEESVLYIEAGSEADAEYLKRESVLQQLQVFVSDVSKVEKVKIK